MVPLCISFLYREPLQLKAAYAASVLIILLVTLIGRKKPENATIYAKEGLVIVSLCWILLSFFGALPFVFSGEIPHLVDAFFETASGFTTTGCSVIDNLDSVSRSNLFWRSFTLFIGGMGVLVLALAVFPDFNTSSIHMMKAELPGPQFGKLLSKLIETARALYIIYIIMTALLVFLLRFGGISWFDSLLLAFGTAGTGGFSISNKPLLAYNSAYLEWVLGIGMILFGINFNLYFLIYLRKWKEALNSEELRAYLLIIALSVVLIIINILPGYTSLNDCIRDTFFTVSSIISSTGYMTVDFSTWPAFSQVILLLLMFIGGCAGSTAGGLKISRVVIFIKAAFLHLKRMINPNSVVVLTFEKKKISIDRERDINNYFLVYALLFCAFMVIDAISTPDLSTSFGSVAATFNNIGLSVGEFGLSSGFSSLGYVSKLVLSLAMIVGRLEIFPMLVLFSPQTWRKT